MSSKKDLAFVGNATDLEYTFPNQDYLSAWDSFEAFTRHIEVMKPGAAWHDSAWSQGSDFYGCKDMPTALDMARGGWKEGVEKVERMRNRIMTLFPISKKAVRYGVVGSVPSVPRAVAGNPLNMKILENNSSTKRKTITLISVMGANWSASTDTLSNRGAVVAAVVDHIEATGFSCEIITTAKSFGSWSGTAGYEATTAIRVKEPNHPVDISRLAFSLGHASMFRRLVFADWGMHRKNSKGLGSGLGHLKKDQEVNEAHAEKQIYTLPSPEANHGMFGEEERAVTEGLKFIIYELRRQGCPAFPRWDVDVDGPRDEPFKLTDDDYDEEDDL